MTPHAIETRYRGYRCRSRLEARWLCFFDELGIRFWYEPEGFALKSGWYLPDLKLPVVNMYAEVKPAELTSVERQRCEELAVATTTNTLTLVGPPDFRTYEVITGNTQDAYHTTWHTTLDIDARLRKEYNEGRLWACDSTDFVGEDCFTPQYRSAVYASRAARFEEGA